MDSLYTNKWVWIIAAAVFLIAIQLVRRHLRRGTDIQWPTLPATLKWGDAASSEEALGRVYEYVTGFSNSSVGWYQSRRRPKRIAGFALRAGALLATVTAGLVPLADAFGIENAPPELSTVLLALAGLCVSIDSLGGFTSGWVRYMLAQQKIERLRDAFLLEWNALKIVPDTQVMLERAKVFLLTVGKVVDDETLEWATEFQNALKELERARKTEAEIQRTGAVEITVKNPGLVKEWTLEIDGTQRGRTRGKTLAVTDVIVGIRKARASGQNDEGKMFSDEKTLKVEGGAVVTRELELT